jgi:hypothetical protein
MPVKSLYASLATCPLIVGIGMVIIGRMQQRISQNSSPHGAEEPVKPLSAEAGIPN